MEYINEYLPEDIAVLSCEVAPERFHSRLSAVRKTYCYQLEMGPKKDVFQRNYYYGLGERLDVSAMKAAAGLLTGTHDFKSFRPHWLRIRPLSMPCRCLRRNVLSRP